jgi:hypothetical protein
MADKTYVVTMYRWGGRENHSYFLGLFTDKDEAIKAGERHHTFRGNKYDPEVLEVVADQVYGSETAVQEVEICGLKHSY